MVPWIGRKQDVEEGPSGVCKARISSGNLQIFSRGVRKRSLLGIEREPHRRRRSLSVVTMGSNGCPSRATAGAHTPKSLLVGAGWKTVGKLRGSVDVIAQASST